MANHTEVPPEIVAKIRSTCIALPEALEEQAWVGTRWRIRRQTFAHVVAIDAGWPPAYAKAAGSDGPLVVLTFQSSGQELDALTNLGHPFFRPPWRPGIVGTVVDSSVDWDEVAELVIESYCVLAPRKLIEQINRPTR